MGTDLFCAYFLLTILYLFCYISFVLLFLERFFMENIESQVRVINKTADIQVWWFISIYILLQFLFTSFLYFARDNFAPAYALLLALFDIIIT